MSEAMTPVDKDDPRWLAWQEYVKTDTFANTRRWALCDEGVDGSLWAAFIYGWQCALSVKKG